MVTFRDDPRVVFCHAKRRESTLTAGSKGENLTRHPVCPPLRTGKTTHKVTAHEMMSLRTFPRGHTGQRGLRATNTRRDPTHNPSRSTPRRHTRHQTRHPHRHRPHPQARREHPPDRTHPRPPSRRHTHRSDLHWRTLAGSSVGSASNISATTPVACGVAMLVPCIPR